MRSRLVSALLLSAAVFLTAFPSIAQAAVQNRVVSAVNGGSRVALLGTVSGHAKHSIDLGVVPGDRKLDSLSVRFSMTPAQQADLNQLLADQLNPASPNYHQWLTSEQFGARFGLSSGDIAKVSAWLTSQGFTITSVAKSATFITFNGTVAQVQQAFGTTIHNVSLNGEQHITNLTEPTLPSAIANVVLAVTGLNDFRLKPRSRARNVNADSLQPGFTSTVSGVTSHYIAPGDLYTIYSYPPASSNINGTGVTIAVMGQTQIRTTDVAAFQSAAGLPTKTPTLTLVPTSNNPGIVAGDIDEGQIDVEWTGASAPGANINFVYSTDVISGSLTYAVDASPTIAPIITISYGGCESGFGASFVNTVNQLLQMANAKGITVMSSSGDDGATDCDTSGIASEGLNVDFPSSSPYATSAGGTQFSADVSNASTYWNSSNATNNSSAKSYIPEVPWNETTASGGLDAGGAGGGGASAFFSKPAWQVGAGVPNDSSRDIPDVSLNAAAMHDGYVVCSQGSCTNGFLAANGQPDVFGGTSFVAPSLAGILAMVEQHLGTTGGLGNIGPILYGLANGPNPTNIFNTIQTGNNSVVCSQGTPNCPSGGSIGYTASGSPGYNQAIGLGSLQVANLINAWAGATPAGAGSTIGAGITTTSLTTSNALCGVSSGSKVPLNITVTSSGTAPTGTVQILVDSAVAGTATLASGATTANATASFSLDTTALSSGGHTISAVYTGDGNFAGSKGTLFGPVTTPQFYPNGTPASFDIVSSTKADFSLGPCTGAATAVTVNPGATSTGVAFTITPANGFTGTVNFTATNNDGMTATTSFTPTSVNVTSGAITTSFVVKAFQTTAQLTQPGLTPFQHHQSGRTSWYAAGSGATLACMLLFAFPRRRRWARLLAIILSVAALTVVGCGGNTSTTGGGSGGGGGGGGGGTTNAQAGTYTFTITAVSGGLVHSSQVTVNVP